MLGASYKGDRPNSQPYIIVHSRNFSSFHSSLKAESHVYFFHFGLACFMVHLSLSSCDGGATATKKSGRTEGQLPSLERT